MKALSVKQPYASWTVDGSKTVEMRTWETSYRGPIVVCATKVPDHLAMPVGTRKGELAAKFPNGVALGVVSIVDCRPMAYEDEAAARVKLVPGAYAWVLRDPYAFVEPFPVVGQLGLFDIPFATVTEHVLNARRAGA